MQHSINTVKNRNRIPSLKFFVALFLLAVAPVVTHAIGGGGFGNQIDGGGGGYFEASYYAQSYYQGSYTPPPVTQCNDGIDNDSNGPVDYPADLGCTSGSDSTESGYVTTVCSDTVDNDNDGQTDLVDPGCSSSADTSEDPNPQCSDLNDNDLNGRTDYPSDLGCTSASDTTESGYIPPVVPGVGVVEFSGYPNSYATADASAHGGISVSSGASVFHGTGGSASVQGQRICYLIDTTGFPSAWTSGGYHSPEDNRVLKWNTPYPDNWGLYAAKGNNDHYKSLECKTYAVPDTTISASVATTTSGGAVTLFWYSVKGKVRQGTFTSNNYSLVTTIPEYCVQVDTLECEPGCGASDPGATCAYALDKGLGSSQTALPVNGACYTISTVECYPANTAARPYGGSTTVNPTQTTTYSYTGTNANGSSVASVTVTVAGSAQCANLVDDDGDGLVDSSDPGCTTSGTNPTVFENSDRPDLTVSAVTQIAAPQSTATLLSATVTNGGGSATSAGFTNLFQIDNDTDHTTVYTSLTDTSPAVAKTGTDVTTVNYTFPTAGTWYVRVCADNNASFVGTVTESNENNNCDAGATNWHTVTVTSIAPTASLSASPTSVASNDPSMLTWTCGNSTSASIDNGIGAVSPVSTGSVSTGALTTTKSYTLTCSGTGGTQPAFAQVTVSAPTVNIFATPATLIKKNATVLITWTSNGATSCSITGPGISSTNPNSSQTVTITSQSVYTITCNGVSTKSITVSLVPEFKEQ